jgi:hypothetical protein
LAAVLENSKQYKRAEENFEIAALGGIEQASENLRALRAKMKKEEIV